MRESEHFNLNLVEGSDIVNPLVQDVPNYETIDEQLFKNQNAGVCNATELKTGTVHALTRLVPDAQMITFTATSNFTAGDTFTVDGVQVSALTVAGETLPTGAYVINSQVLACLKGSLLTIYGVGKELASDSERLGGELPSYYGTKEEVDNALDTATAAKDLVDAVEPRVTSLEQDIQNKSTVITRTIQGNLTVPTNFAGQIDVNVPVVSGYTPTGIITIQNTSGVVSVNGFYISGNQAHIRISNMYSSQQATTITATVLYVK